MDLTKRDPGYIFCGGYSAVGTFSVSSGSSGGKAPDFDTITRDCLYHVHLHRPAASAGWSQSASQLVRSGVCWVYCCTVYIPVPRAPTTTRSAPGSFCSRQCAILLRPRKSMLYLELVRGTFFALCIYKEHVSFLVKIERAATRATTIYCLCPQQCNALSVSERYTFRKGHGRRRLGCRSLPSRTDNAGEKMANPSATN